MNKTKLGIIFYGNPEQYPVNQQQFNDLKKELVDFEVRKYDLNKNEWSKLLKDFKQKKIDVVLKNSYGRGHEADVEKFLESKKIAFFGSGSRFTIVGTSKFLSKKLFRQHHLPVIQDVYFEKNEWKNNKKKFTNKIDKIFYPCIIKDVGGTDSRGLFVAHNKAMLIKGLRNIFANSKAVIVEKFLENAYEATCFVIGNKQAKAYEPIGMRTKGVLDAKIKDQGLKMQIPTRLPINLRKRIKNLAIKAHQALGCQTFSRSDFLIKSGKIYILETDVHPGFRKASATTKSAEYQGQSLNDLFNFFYKLLKK